MEKIIYDESNGLWYELQGDYYLPCLKPPEEEPVHIGIWGEYSAQVEHPDRFELNSLTAKTEQSSRRD